MISKTGKTSKPIYIENFEVLNGYRDSLDDLLEIEQKSFESLFDQSFDESVEEAAEELERISKVQDLDDALLSENPFGGPTRITGSQKVTPAHTVVVYFSGTSNNWKQKS